MTGTRHAVVLAVVLAFASFGLTMASQQRPYRVTDQQLKDLVKRIETHRDAFHTSVTRAIDRSPIHDTPADEDPGI
jgi:signal transduction histidine kinase